MIRKIRIYKATLNPQRLHYLHVISSHGVNCKGKSDIVDLMLSNRTRLQLSPTCAKSIWDCYICRFIHEEVDFESCLMTKAKEITLKD